MKHRNRHEGGRGRWFFSPEGHAGSAPEGRQGGRCGRGGGRHRHRLFDYGEMRLLVLSLISEKPTYGYELIRTIEERFAGSYTPSPGVIYPTLTWLEEAGYVTQVEADGRKHYHITPQGTAFLGASSAAVEEILTRVACGAAEGRGGRRAPVPVMRAMENLKTSLRLRLRNGRLDAETEEKIAALIDEAARAVSRL
ncbi:MAG: PadR family transcriptional regulator [Acetobacter sp.]|uniref:PadR family transcriptional regulator n=1 Tax=Acetobacter sp. TaxID=440 RepID=UPI003D01634E